MKKVLLFTLIGAAMVACSGERKASDENVNAEIVEDSIKTADNLTLSKWKLIDYAGDEEVQIVNPESSYQLSFSPEENTFSMETDCNNISGNYVIAGDSLTFNDMISTMRACPDEKIEQGMKQILPMITTYTIANDSILLLRSDARIMATFSKAN